MAQRPPISPLFPYTTLFRSPHAPRLVGPAAASEDPVVGVTARVEVVPAPLPDIAEQVREPEGIGAFPPDGLDPVDFVPGGPGDVTQPDRKSTRLNSSHVAISYAV